MYQKTANSTPISRVNKNSKIGIIGAGPAGLSSAWYLAKNGFKNVTVLEKLSRVGGLCKSLTVDGRSFDLGANYVTWAYRETLKIAKELGAETYEEKPYVSLNINDTEREFTFGSFQEAMLMNPYTQQKESWFTFFKAAIRYFFIRLKWSKVIDAPGYLNEIHSYPEICISFKDWLIKNKLTPLATLFSFPITIMGYGQLHEIATPYALRYMSIRTFFPFVFGRFPIISWFVGQWPRRFNHGFQRLWERVAWHTDVRLNVHITSIERTEKNIEIEFQYSPQDLYHSNIEKRKESFEYLIYAAPFTPQVFEQMGLLRNELEKKISEAVRINPYCMTTFWVENMNMSTPIAPILPIPEKGMPYAIARQFQEHGNMFTQFYTHSIQGQTDEEVVDRIRHLIKLLKGNINVNQSRWNLFERYLHFQHFTPEQIMNGIYTDLAKMQGLQRTFYVGGPTDFGLVEPIVQHSKHIVEKFFVGHD